MKYCTSCGSSIPDNQGNSCSMCYGDINYGRDGYYQQQYDYEYEVRREQRQVQEIEYEQQQEEK